MFGKPLKHKIFIFILLCYSIDFVKTDIYPYPSIDLDPDHSLYSKDTYYSKLQNYLIIGSLEGDLKLQTTCPAFQVIDHNNQYEELSLSSPLCILKSEEFGFGTIAFLLCDYKIALYSFSSGLRNIKKLWEQTIGKDKIKSCSKMIPISNYEILFLVCESEDNNSELLYKVDLQNVQLLAPITQTLTLAHIFGFSQGEKIILIYQTEVETPKTSVTFDVRELSKDFQTVTRTQSLKITTESLDGYQVGDMIMQMITFEDQLYVILRSQSTKRITLKLIKIELDFDSKDIQIKGNKKIDFKFTFPYQPGTQFEFEYIKQVSTKFKIVQNKEIFFCCNSDESKFSCDVCGSIKIPEDEMMVKSVYSKTEIGKFQRERNEEEVVSNFFEKFVAITQNKEDKTFSYYTSVRMIGEASAKSSKKGFKAVIPFFRTADHFLILVNNNSIFRINPSNPKYFLIKIDLSKLKLPLTESPKLNFSESQSQSKAEIVYNNPLLDSRFSLLTAQSDNLVPSVLAPGYYPLYQTLQTKRSVVDGYIKLFGNFESIFFSTKNEFFKDKFSQFAGVEVDIYRILSLNVESEEVFLEGRTIFIHNSPQFYIKILPICSFEIFGSQSINCIGETRLIMNQPLKLIASQVLEDKPKNFHLPEYTIVVTFFSGGITYVNFVKYTYDPKTGKYQDSLKKIKLKKEYFYSHISFDSTIPNIPMRIILCAIEGCDIYNINLDPEVNFSTNLNDETKIELVDQISKKRTRGRKLCIKQVGFSSPDYIIKSSCPTGTGLIHSYYRYYSFSQTNKPPLLEIRLEKEFPLEININPGTNIWTSVDAPAQGWLAIQSKRGIYFYYDLHLADFGFETITKAIQIDPENVMIIGVKTNKKMLIIILSSSYDVGGIHENGNRNNLDNLWFYEEFDANYLEFVDAKPIFIPNLFKREKSRANINFYYFELGLFNSMILFKFKVLNKNKFIYHLRPTLQNIIMEVKEYDIKDHQKIEIDLKISNREKEVEFKMNMFFVNSRVKFTKLKTNKKQTLDNKEFKFDEVVNYKGNYISLEVGYTDGSLDLSKLPKIKKRIRTEIVDKAQVTKLRRHYEYLFTRQKSDDPESDELLFKLYRNEKLIHTFAEELKNENQTISTDVFKNFEDGVVYITFWYREEDPETREFSNKLKIYKFYSDSPTEKPKVFTPEFPENEYLWQFLPNLIYFYKSSKYGVDPYLIVIGENIRTVMTIKNSKRAVLIFGKEGGAKKPILVRTPSLFKIFLYPTMLDDQTKKYYYPLWQYSFDFNSKEKSKISVYQIINHEFNEMKADSWICRELQNPKTLKSGEVVDSHCVVNFVDFISAYYYPPSKISPKLKFLAVLKQTSKLFPLELKWQLNRLGMFDLNDEYIVKTKYPLSILSQHGIKIWKIQNLEQQNGDQISHPQAWNTSIDQEIEGLGYPLQIFISNKNAEKKQIQISWIPQDINSDHKFVTFTDRPVSFLIGKDTEFISKNLKAIYFRVIHGNGKTFTNVYLNEVFNKNIINPAIVPLLKIFALIGIFLFIFLVSYFVTKNYGRDKIEYEKMKTKEDNDNEYDDRSATIETYKELSTDISGSKFSDLTERNNMET